MKIKKKFQGTVPDNKVLNTKSESETNVYSCKYINDNIDVDNNYSTAEQRIGTWIDGKPLYRKVVTGTTKNVVSGEIDTKIGITNVDTVISYSANVDGWIITYLTRLINLSGTLRLDIMNQESGSGFSVKPFKCIVEYTKTTD